VSAFAEFVADPFARRRCLVVLEPWDPLLGATATLRYSDDGFTSRPDDVPPNTHFEARVAEALNLTRNLVARDGRLGGRSEADEGALTLANGDGGLDFLGDLGWDGRRVRVWLGGEGFSFGDFGLVFDGTAEGIALTDEAVTIRLRSRAARTQKPLQASLYAGSGGSEGGVDLKGKPKPLAFGTVRNVTPVLVSYADLLWQVHDGPVQAIAVYSAGAAVSAGADHASLSALLSATIAPGSADTCLGAGCFRLGSAPGGSVVTADVDGDCTGGVFAGSTARILQRIAETRAGFAPEDIDIAAFEALHAANGAAVGLYAGADAPEAAEAFDRLCNSVGAWWGFGRDGRLTAGRLEAPAGPPVANYDTLSIIELERLPSALPPWRHILSYRRNWRPFQPGEVAGSVDAARREFLLTPWREEGADAPAVATAHPLAPEARLETLLDAAAAAAAEATRLQSLYGAGALVWSARLKTPPFALQLNDVIEVTWPRWGLASGRLLRVVGFTEIAGDNEVTLTLWG